MQRIQPPSPEGNTRLDATCRRITETRGYVSAVLMSLSHAPAGLDAFARLGEYARYGTELPGRVRELAGTIAPAEKAAIRCAREFGQGGKVSDAAFAALERRFSERQITDLTLLCGYFLALGSIIHAFRVELESQFAPKAGRV